MLYSIKLCISDVFVIFFPLLFLFLSSSYIMESRRCYWVGSVKRCNVKQSAMGASYGDDMTNDQPGTIYFLDRIICLHDCIA